MLHTMNQPSHQIKLGLKQLLLSGVSVIGELPLPEPLRNWICGRVCPKLLDERLISSELIPRPLKGLDVTILCNPYQFPHRAPYWFGQLHETELDMYLRRELSQGDTVIDVGCNVGHVTMMAAALVGPQGHVYSFDPQLNMAEITETHCKRQNLDQVKVFPIGLSTEEGEFELQINPNQLGRTTLRDVNAENGGEDAKFTQTATATIKVGNDILSPLTYSGRTFLKVDVEGHEPQVLQGMSKVLKEHVDHAVLEVTPEWLGGAAGIRDLLTLMADHGLQHHHMMKNGRVGPPIDPDTVTEQIDAVFVRE